MPVGRHSAARCCVLARGRGLGRNRRRPGAVVTACGQRGRDELNSPVDPRTPPGVLGARTGPGPGRPVRRLVVDFASSRVLSPVARTSLSLFERIASFFVQRERTAYYLRRSAPFPWPFVSRPGRARRALSSTPHVLVIAPLPGRSRRASRRSSPHRRRAASMATASCTLLRPGRATPQDIPSSAPAAHARSVSRRRGRDPAARQLGDAIGQRFLRADADATLAPLTEVASLRPLARHRGAPRR